MKLLELINSTQIPLKCSRKFLLDKLKIDFLLLTIHAPPNIILENVGSKQSIAITKI